MRYIGEEEINRGFREAVKKALADRENTDREADVWSVLSKVEGMVALVEELTKAEND